MSGAFRLYKVSAQQREERGQDSGLIAVSTGLVSLDVRIKSVSVRFPLSPSFIYLDVRAAIFS